MPRRKANEIYSESSGVSSGSESEYKRPNKRRRRASPTNTKGAKGNKASQRGTLAQVLDLPLDILYEVFKHLEPGDLLHLSRVSKAFRNIFIKKSATQLWRCARANVGLPDGPSDLSEVRYAKLIFDVHCDYCHKAITKNILWFNYTRACKHCAADEMKFTNRLLDHLEVDLSILALVTAQHQSFSGGSYCICTAQKLKKEYTKLSDDEKPNWLSDRKLQAKARAEHGEVCAAWFKARAAQRSSARDHVRQMRFEAILDKLCDLGWEEEIVQMEQNDIISLKFHGAVWRTEELTDEIWDEIQSTVIRMMTNFQSRRLEREYRKLQKDRRGLFRDAYFKYIISQPLDAILPGPADLALMPEIKDVVNSPVEEEITFSTFEGVLETCLPEMAAKWRRSVDEGLLAILKKHVPQAEISDLSRPTTIFRCTLCNPRRHIHYPQVLVHPCAKRTYRTLIEEDKAIIADLRCNPYELSSILHDQATCDQSMKLLQSCGLDPGAVTLEELQKPTFIFECKQCPTADPERPRILMTWGQAVSHYSSHPDVDMCKANINEEDMMLVNCTLANNVQTAKEALWRRGYTACWVCVPCRQTFEWVGLRSHFKECHGRHDSLVEDADYILNIDGRASVYSTVIRIK